MSHRIIALLDAQEKFTIQVSAGHHQFKIDEPISYGGSDKGPSPNELIASALGACTAITLKMYASRKEWDLGNIEVEVDYNIEHYKECETCEETPFKQDVFKHQIRFSKPLNEKQKERLLFIANKCPVHKYLENK